MKNKQLHSRILGLIGLVCMMGLIGCSKDEAAEPKSERSTEVQLAGYVADYDEAPMTNRSHEAYGTTRAWTPPSGYSAFETGEQSISVFFTEGTTAGDERFFFTSSGKWRVSGEELPSGTYYLYGYVPHDKSINTTLSVLPDDGKTYADGAILTMANVPTVSSADFCVMIAAKNGKDDYKSDADYSVTNLKRGDFAYTSAEKNYVYLLFDHLFSALRLRMRVQGDYNNLRTIKLKELKLKTYEGETPITKKTNVIVTLTANGEGNDPIKSVTFEPYGTETEAGSMFTSETGHELKETYQEFTGHFMPQGVTKLILESTYDVYDKKGNKLRLNCKAQNTINISELFTLQTEALRGRRYTINLTINPTYLYVLSEPDLNDPTVTVE